jgi:hypothetical protein
VSGDVQLRMAETGLGLPFDPAELAQLPIVDRTKAYSDLGLDAFQRQAAEEAVRLIQCGMYQRPVR